MEDNNNSRHLNSFVLDEVSLSGLCLCVQTTWYFSALSMSTMLCVCFRNRKLACINGRALSWRCMPLLRCESGVDFFINSSTDRTRCEHRYVLDGTALALKCRSITEYFDSRAKLVKSLWVERGKRRSDGTSASSLCYIQTTIKC